MPILDNDTKGNLPAQGVSCGGGVGAAGVAGGSGKAGRSDTADGAEPTGRPGSGTGSGGLWIRCRSMVSIMGCSVNPV
jgi:hypothetical protein